MMMFATIFDEVAAEAARGEAKHGPLGTCAGRPISSAPSPRLCAVAGGLEALARLDLEELPTVAAILAEEVGEALTASDTEALRGELVQVAAVAVRWIALIDHGRARELGEGR